MLRIGKKSNYSPQEVLQKAVAFFKEQGGLTLARQSPTMVYLVGGGGHVQVMAEPHEEGETEVDIESREWDYDVKQFLKEL
jgi:hypothetical protein